MFRWIKIYFPEEKVLIPEDSFIVKPFHILGKNDFWVYEDVPLADKKYFSNVDVVFQKYTWDPVPNHTGVDSILCIQNLYTFEVAKYLVYRESIVHTVEEQL